MFTWPGPFFFHLLSSFSPHRSKPWPNFIYFFTVFFLSCFSFLIDQFLCLFSSLKYYYLINSTSLWFLTFLYLSLNHLFNLTFFSLYTLTILWTRIFGSMCFPLEWRVRFLFFKNDFIWLRKLTWSRHLFLFYF